MSTESSEILRHLQELKMSGFILSSINSLSQRVKSFASSGWILALTAAAACSCNCNNNNARLVYGLSDQAMLLDGDEIIAETDEESSLRGSRIADLVSVVATK